MKQMFKHHEHLKKRAYNARVLEVEKGTFTTLVFSTTGGMGPEAEMFVKQLARKMTIKDGSFNEHELHQTAPTL